MFCRYPQHVSLGFNGHTERVTGELVSGTYFPVLGVGAAMGRTFTPDDDRIPDGHPVMMLSYSYWKTRFAGDPSIAGKTVIMNGHNFTVVGVAQKGFDGVELGYADTSVPPDHDARRSDADVGRAQFQEPPHAVGQCLRAPETGSNPRSRPRHRCSRFSTACWRWK